MLKSGKQIRFSPAEVEQAAAVGIDLSKVTTKAEYSNAIIDMITALEHDHERPDLLEKIAVALAKKTGVKLPPKLTVV